MIHLHLQGHSERITNDAAFFPHAFNRYRPLEAQQRTYEALAASSANIVLNTYATGSGKTNAALLYLHQLGQQNSLVIAPTNELLRQHATDITTYCQDNDLDYQVLPLTRAHMNDYAEQIAHIDPHATRRATKLERVLRDPRCLEDANGQPARPQQPYILVTNPDIFYQAIFRGYGRNEEREVMKLFIRKFGYVIIDEFHYYNPKQAANFLFFFKLWEKFGYFAAGAKVCLLSATPNQRIRTYLNTLGVAVTEISPDNEPEDATAQRVASLAPLDLTVYTTDELSTEGLIALVRQQIPTIKERLAAGQHGAIISGALWRIDLIYDVLRNAGIAAERLGRITGPQKPPDRAIATTRDLILATPTVDLGYNFARPGTTRQNIDFLIFDAAFADEFVQRLGRAGRVLGKPETAIPSMVVALVPPRLGAVLQPLADSVISRSELRHRLSEALRNEQLVERQALFEYVATGAIFEAFLPILRLHDMGGEAILADLRDLFDQICALYETPHNMCFDALKKITHCYLRDDALFRSAPTERHALFTHLLSVKEDQAVKAWLQDTYPGKSADARSAKFTQLKQEVRQRGKAHDLFQAWAMQTQQRYTTRAASFHFRDSFQGPQARIDDPNQYLSDARINDVDALHVIQNCEVTFLQEAAWQEASGESRAPDDERDIAFFGRIRGLLPAEQRLSLSFHLTSKEERKMWEEAHLCKMTAVLGLELATDHGQLPPSAIRMLAERYQPAFITPHDHWVGGKLRNLATEYGLRWYSLEVLFSTGSVQQYYVMLGTAALLAAANLRQSAAVFHKQRANADHDMIWS